MPVTTRSKTVKINKSNKKKTVIRKTKAVKSNKKTKQKKLSLKNLYIKKYKKGLKIETDTKSSLWGEHYVKLGDKWMYWNDNMTCWFCSTTCEDELLKQGAKWFSQKKTVNKNSTEKRKSKKSKKVSVPTQLFKDMTLETYGKGYLLVPKKNHADWGEKYYNNGWWMSSKKAWFFKKEWHNFLMVNGATSLEDNVSDISEYSDEYQELDKSLFKGTVLKNYKNGLILKPKKSHPDWGEKYYHNGFWNGSLKSWVFKPDAKKFLVTHGAKLSQ
jgi:hypothetical protein